MTAPDYDWVEDGAAGEARDLDPVDDHPPTLAEITRDEAAPAMPSRPAPRRGSCPECGVLAGCWHGDGCSQPVDPDVPQARAS